jgi:hypothetical protein
LLPTNHRWVWKKSKGLAANHSSSLIKSAVNPILGKLKSGSEDYLSAFNEHPWPHALVFNPSDPGLMRRAIICRFVAATQPCFSAFG